MKCNNLRFYEYPSRYQYLFHCTLCLYGLFGFSSKANWVDLVGVEALPPVSALPTKKKRRGARAPWGTGIQQATRPASVRDRM
jgi:hypothetical protein